jgi:hypothetical protein
MDFKVALSVVKAFPDCNPRVYKQFAGFPENSIQESSSGYVLFVDSSQDKNQSCCELRDFAEEHNMSITSFGNYLMISGKTNKF